MIILENVTKSYSEKSGNFNIDLKINTGQVLGILGANGAGKTTLIREILGFIRPDSGLIELFGLKPIENNTEIMSFTGYVAGEIALYEQLTGLGYLKMIYKLKPNTDWEFVEKLIEHFELEVKTKIKKMSKGMKQKVAIIAAVMNKPKFLVLDEPTSGLDPVMQDKFNQLINKLKKEHNTTVIICSHIFEEIAKLCDEICFIKEGKIVSQQKVQDNGFENIEKEFRKIYERESVL